MMNKPSLKHDQSGMAAIIVTMIIMVLVTIIVLSFSQLIRREQRQALERQLNSQAFYAAETAINAVNAALDDGISSANLNMPNCNTPNTNNSDSTQLLSSLPNSPELAITCLIINPLSYNLEFSSIGEGTAQIAHLKANSNVAGGGFRTVEFAWQGTGNTSTYASGTAFEPSSSWTPTTPVIRVDMMPIGAPNQLDLNGMYADVYTYFLYPRANGPGVSDNDDRRGSIVYADCNAANTPRDCRARILLNPAPPASSEYYLRIRPIYRNADLVVTGYDVNGNVVQLTDGQITIDATARSSDILKRVSVRRPAISSSITPIFAIDSGSDICKKILTMPGLTSDTECGLN
jgi:Tfp pilus assembly protein PilX